MLGSMQVLAVSEADRARYDAAVAASPLADFMQSFAWGEVKKRTGWDALRLLVTDDDGRARAACSILRKKEVRGVPPILYAPRGPVLDHTDTEALRALLDAIRARAGDAFLFKCDPAIEAGSEAATALTAAGLRIVTGGTFGGVQPAQVMVLDLSIGLDKVFEGFKSKWRYNVRLAERKGVTVRDGGRDDLEAFHRLYLETARRDGFTGRGRTYFDALWDELAPHGLVKMFLAEHEGEVIAGILVMPMGERAIYTYGASSNEKRNLMPNHLIQWTAIRWAAEAGLRIYDFRGVSEHVPGLKRFKEGFGAREVAYAGEFDLPLRAGWYALWRTAGATAIRLRSKLRGGPEAAD